MSSSGSSFAPKKESVSSPPKKDSPPREQVQELFAKV
jgi:hypothetical protein